MSGLTYRKNKNPFLRKDDCSERGEGLLAFDGMSNVLSEQAKQQVIGLGRLGWSLRCIQQETGVRRATASVYLKTAGIQVPPPGRRKQRAAKPAISVTTGSTAELAPPNPDPNPENFANREKPQNRPLR